MNKDFDKDFKNLNKDDIVDFIIQWSKDLYGAPILYKGDKLNKPNHTIHYLPEENSYGLYHIACSKEDIWLFPFSVQASNCSETKLELAWKKYLHKKSSHFVPALIESHKNTLKNIIKKSNKKLNEEIEELTK